MWMALSRHTRWRTSNTLSPSLNSTSVAGKITPSAGTRNFLFSTHLSILSRMVSQEMENIHVCVTVVSTAVSCGSTGAGFPSGMGSVMYCPLSPVSSGCSICGWPQATQDSRKRTARNRETICLHFALMSLLLLDATVAADHTESQQRDDDDGQQYRSQWCFC